MPAMGTAALKSAASARTRASPAEAVISALDAYRAIQSVYGPSPLLTCKAAMSAAPTAPMNAIRTEVRRRPGLSLSSSVSRCCNQIASAYNRRHTAGARHSDRSADRTLLLAAVCATVPLNRHHRRRAHAKGTFGGAVLDNDAHGETLGEPHPVQRRLHRG